LNYLSHFYLDEHLADAAFSVGGALPDLSRLRGKGFRLKPGHFVGDVALNPLQTRIEAGIARHFAIDAHWHNAPLFTHLEHQTRQILAEAGIRVRRTSFLGHIGAEMLLDRALLHRDPLLAHRFYAAFTNEVLAEVYPLAALKGHADWVPKLQTGMAAFLKRRYLVDYAGDYLSKTWPDMYQHITQDDAVCLYPTTVWMEVVEAITQRFLQEVDFEGLKYLIP
jgi:hypothetical protein